MPPLYQPPPSRIKLLALPSPTTTVMSDSGLASAILATQAADRLCAIENSVRLSSDGSAPFETLAIAAVGASGDQPLPVEARAMVLTPRSLAIEGQAPLLGDIPAPVEWSGAARLAADAVVPLEGAAATNREQDAPAEAIALVLPQEAGTVEWLVADRTDAGSATEMLAGLVRDDRGPVEWLGTGATIIADAMLALGWPGASPALLLSLESGPGRTRLLATPGRVRLVRRN